MRRRTIGKKKSMYSKLSLLLKNDGGRLKVNLKTCEISIMVRVRRGLEVRIVKKIKVVKRGKKVWRIVFDVWYITYLIGRELMVICCAYEY